MVRQMKDYLLSSERRQRILDVVNQKRSISVEELAQHFPVSTITIRRDLDMLAGEKRLLRVHGGAMTLSSIVTAPRASELFANITEDQIRIGREASTRIADGNFIIIESGSTCLALVQNLNEKKNLKVVTVSPRIVTMLAEISDTYNNNFEIISSGGILNSYKNFFFGPHARTLFEGIKVDIAFVSVTAIDLKAGVTADSAYEAEISKTILEKCAKMRVGLIHSSKFEITSFVKVTTADIFDEIITDTNLSQDITDTYTDAGIKVTAV
jgi:DeoR/GlpR family transcriptional regulator of sugar metabolism